jgi:serine/threonine protein kinase
VTTLTRAELRPATAGYIKRGAWNKADVLRVVHGGRTYAVKDYAAKGALVRWAGALQLRREVRAYTRLAGVAGIPRFFGALDAHAIVLERLRELMEAVHGRGVIHGDLRSRDNFLVTPDGALYLIDFSSAAVFEPEGWRGRWIFPWLLRAEDRALLKWKVALVPGELTMDELAAHRRFKRWRWLWPFNRKKDLPRTRGRNPLL